MSAFVQHLEELLGPERVSGCSADLTAYARDLWPRNQLLSRAGDAAPFPPQLVVWPETTEEVAAIVRAAHQQGVPVVPFGAGSGVCGGVKPTRQTIVIDLKRMRRVLELDGPRMECHVEAGMLGQRIEDHLAERGFTLGHFPSSIYCSTVGGWVAARSAGQCSGRYGKIEDMVRGLTFVDGEGNVRVVERGGVDASLIPLLIGSEGILGIVTSVRLRVAPAPERRFAGFYAPDVETGIAIMREVYQRGLRPAVARLYDPFNSVLNKKHHAHYEDGESKRKNGPGTGTRALAKLLRAPRMMNFIGSDLGLGEAKMVYVWEGTPRVTEHERVAVREIALRHGAREEGEGLAKYWLAHRHDVSYRQSPFYNAGAFVDTMEVSASWSRLLPMYRAVRAATEGLAFTMAHFSHSYPDGACIYFTFAAASANDDDALVKYDAIWDGALKAVVQAGGSISHHHGVGRSKAPRMRDEQNRAIEVVKAIKSELDPAGIFNPGNLIGDAPGPSEEPRRVGVARQSNLGQGNASDLSRPATTSALCAAITKLNTHKSKLMFGETLSLESLTGIIAIDDVSLLVEVRGGTRLGELERALRDRDLTLGHDRQFDGLTVHQWLSDGAPSGPDVDDDPVRQLIAGAEIVLPTGELMHIKPAPRRAVGPDLVSAFIGSRGLLGVFASAHLLVRRRRPLVTLSKSISDAAEAEISLTKLRGQALRPLRSAIVAGQISLVFEAGTPELDATIAYARELLDAPEGSEGEPHFEWPASKLGSFVLSLAERLDPNGVLKHTRSELGSD